MKYEEHEIDIATTNFTDGVAILPLPDGSIKCLPEQDATAEELAIIAEVKADVENRVIVVPEPTEEEIRSQYESLTVRYIREKYSQDDENKVIREYLSDMANTDFKSTFEMYNTYVIACKQRAQEEAYGGEPLEG